MQERPRQLFTQWFADGPPLTYQVISLAHLRSRELAEYAKGEFGGAFDLQLDDNIIQEYEIFKVRIRNDGPAVEYGFALEAVVNEGLAKIVDLKHVVRAPANKSILVRNSLPDLRWNAERTIGKVTFSWRDPPNAEVIGSLLYRSTYKEFGYGKLNLGVIRRNCIRLDSKNLIPGYYAVVAVGRNGALSDLSPPVRFPESLALQPYFSDAVRIDPSTSSVADCFPPETRTYSSLKEALAKEAPEQTLIIRGIRAEGDNLLEQAKALEHSGKIFFEDDLKFLAGKLELAFPEGLDGHGEVDFYFLTKGIPGVERSLTLVPLGQSQLSVTKRGEANLAPRKDRTPEVDAKKQSLTPRLIKTYASESAIIFTWPKSAVQAYQGIRVFRRAMDVAKSVGEPGEEMYHGQDVAGTLYCDKDEPSRNNKNKVELPVNDRLAPSEPPIRQGNIPKGGLKDPAAPTGLTTDKGLVGFDTPLFYADGTVRDNVQYKYTIYAYDSGGNYSYPIEIFLSRDDRLPGVSCRFVGRSSK